MCMNRGSLRATLDNVVVTVGYIRVAVHCAVLEKIDEYEVERGIGGRMNTSQAKLTVNNYSAIVIEDFEEANYWAKFGPYHKERMYGYPR